MPDSGAADDPGGDVPQRREDAQRGGDPADHGAPRLLWPHRGQECLLLVPEPQGPRASAPPPTPLRATPAAVRAAAAGGRRQQRRRRRRASGGDAAAPSPPPPPIRNQLHAPPQPAGGMV